MIIILVAAVITIIMQAHEIAKWKEISRQKDKLNSERKIFPQPNEASVTTWYANSEIWDRELRICLLIHDWNKFESQGFYQEMAEYCRNNGIQGSIDTHDKEQG